MGERDEQIRVVQVILASWVGGAGGGGETGGEEPKEEAWRSLAGTRVHPASRLPLP